MCLFEDHGQMETTRDLIFAKIFIVSKAGLDLPMGRIDSKQKNNLGLYVLISK